MAVRSTRANYLTLPRLQIGTLSRHGSRRAQGLDVLTTLSILRHLESSAGWRSAKPPTRGTAALTNFVTSEAYGSASDSERHDLGTFANCCLCRQATDNAFFLHNVDEAVVRELKRAAPRNHGAEQEHREILEQALLRPRRRSLADVLGAMPDVGKRSRRSGAGCESHMPKIRWTSRSPRQPLCTASPWSPATCPLTSRPASPS